MVVKAVGVVSTESSVSPGSDRVQCGSNNALTQSQRSNRRLFAVLRG